MKVAEKQEVKEGMRERSRRELSQGKPQSKSEVTHKREGHQPTNMYCNRCSEKQGQEMTQFKGEGRKASKEKEADVSQNA